MAEENKRMNFFKEFLKSIKDLEKTLLRLKNKKEIFTTEKIANVIQELDCYDLKLRKYLM